MTTKLPPQQAQPDFTFTELTMAATIGCYPTQIFRREVRGDYIEWAIMVPGAPLATVRITHADAKRYGTRLLEVLKNRCADLRWWLREHGAVLWML